MTSVYRKPTFTGMCLQWDSYCPVKYKVGLVCCLVNRALHICSDAKLNELQYMKELFLNNGYPIGVVNKFVSRRAVIDDGKVTLVSVSSFVFRMLVNIIVIWSVVFCLLFIVPLMMSMWRLSTA